MKQVKISEELFYRLYEFFDYLELDCILSELDNKFFIKEYEDIWEELRKKYDAMKRHEAFQAYKCAADPVQREAARRRYLDHAGIQPNCRCTEEIPDDFL